MNSTSNITEAATGIGRLDSPVSIAAASAGRNRQSGPVGDQSLEAALPAASKTGSHTGENGGA